MGGAPVLATRRLGIAIAASFISPGSLAERLPKPLRMGGPPVLATGMVAITNEWNWDGGHSGNWDFDGHQKSLEPFLVGQPPSIARIPETDTPLKAH